MMNTGDHDTSVDDRTRSTGPCAGIRVIDFTSVVSGPVCTQHLGDLGADVIKVEPPIGDFSRLSGGDTHAGLNGFFSQNNRNKRSIVLDLKTPEAVAVAKDLAAQADVVVENYRPGVADRIGIGWDVLRARNSRLIYVAISGFGPTGPYAGHPAYDHLIQGLTGFMPVQGGEGSPEMVQTVVADKVGGLSAVAAVLAALFERERSGLGQRIDVPMLDVYAGFILPDEMGTRTFVDLDPPESAPGSERSSPRSSMFRAYETVDGHVVGIAAQDDQFRGLCRALRREDLIEDERYSTIGMRFANGESFSRVVEGELRHWTTHEFIARAREFGAPFAPVLDVEGFFEDEQVLHNETIRIEDVKGAGPVRFLRPSLRFGRTPAAIDRHPPRLGEHSEEILVELGYDDARREELCTSGAVHSARRQSS
jgi:crotonobetainyl-CoA:carnitine CoA-transferase CaiB-like acyl-CoA transferase